jgi:small subunit ribosomal protein S6
MFILDSGRYARDPEGVSGQISQMIQQIGGEVLISRLWEERRLVYPIAGQRKGTYWLTYFRLDGQRLAELKRNCQVREEIIRFLLLKVEPRLVDVLVEHAKTGQLLTVGQRAGDGQAKPEPPEQVGAAARSPRPSRASHEDTE